MARAADPVADDHIDAHVHVLGKHPYRDSIELLRRAVASPKRIELLDLLCQGPRSVESLAALTGLSEANASQHLKVLRGG